MAEAPAGRLTWLGQASARLELDGITVVIDPWQSPHERRLIPPAPVELAAEGVDWLLITHEHLDHLDLPFLPTVLERSPGVRVVLPTPVAELVEDVVAPDRLHRVLPHDTLDLDGVPLHVVPAYHGVSMADAYGDGSAVGGVPRFVGYVLGARGGVYHAGDTIVRAELTETLRRLDVATALLPVNGRDAEREALDIVGNMDATEAVELALAIGASQLVPIHWDGFAGNTVPAGSAADAAAGSIRVVVPARFEPFALA
jgi:L-ascorbate metabolism protein UlaG (beta-lactamase superfamily)